MSRATAAPYKVSSSPSATKAVTFHLDNANFHYHNLRATFYIRHNDGFHDYVHVNKAWFPPYHLPKMQVTERKAAVWARPYSTSMLGYDNGTRRLPFPVHAPRYLYQRPATSTPWNSQLPQPR